MVGLSVWPDGGVACIKPYFPPHASGPLAGIRVCGVEKGAFRLVCPVFIGFWRALFLVCVLSATGYRFCFVGVQQVLSRCL